MKRLDLFGISFLLTGVCLFGQNIIVHPHIYTNKEAPSYSYYPFGYRSSLQRYRQFRYQQIHDNLSNNPIKIKAMAFRRDGTTPYHPYEAYTVTLELALSTSPKSSTTASRTFDNNMGPDKTTVITKKTIKFPQTNFMHTMPEPFLYKLPFDSGKSFNLGAKKNLCWEAKVYDNNLYTVSKNYIFFDKVNAFSTSPYVRFGHGCFAPGQYKSFIGNMYFSITKTSGKLYGSAENGPFNGYAFALVSFARLKNGMPIGAPCCYLWIDPRLMAVFGPFRFNYSGYYYSYNIVSFQVNPSSYHTVLYGQWAGIDANFSNIYLSNGIKMQKGWYWKPGTGPDVCYVYSRAGTTGTTGYYYKFNGLVVEFTY